MLMKNCAKTWNNHWSGGFLQIFTNAGDLVCCESKSMHEKPGWSCDFKSSWAPAGIRVCWSCHLFIIQALDPLWTRIVTANLLRKEFQRLSSIQRSDVREANEARGECGLQKLISCIQLEPSVLHVLCVFVLIWHYLYLFCIIVLSVA